MANVVIPSNLGNEFDIGVIEAGKIHVKADGTSFFRRTATGSLSAYVFFTGPTLPAAPTADSPKVAIDSVTGKLYAWDGAAWITPAGGGGSDTHMVGTGTDSIKLVAGSNTASGANSSALGGTGNVASGSASTIAGGRNNTASALNSTAMGTDGIASLTDELAHGFGALGATGRTSQFRRIPVEGGLVGPGQFLDVDTPMASDSAWCGTLKVIAQDPGFGGSAEIFISFGSRNTSGTVTVDGSNTIHSYGGGTLIPGNLLITVSGSGGNLRVTLVNLTIAASMNCVALLEVLEIR